MYSTDLEGSKHKGVEMKELLTNLNSLNPGWPKIPKKVTHPIWYIFLTTLAIGAPVMIYLAVSGFSS